MILENKILFNTECVLCTLYLIYNLGHYYTAP